MSYQGHRITGALYICDGSGMSLMGRIWFSSLGFRIQFVGGLAASYRVMVTNAPSQPSRCGVISHDPRAHYPSLPCFEDKLGTYVGRRIHLPLKLGAKPVFLKARSVPYARLAMVDRELDRLEQLQVISPIDYSPWATPLVVVPKKNPTEDDVCLPSTTEVRLCGDYRSTVNPLLLVDQFPLPTPDQLFARLAGASWFTRTDLRLAYAQLEVDEESAMLLTINTHRGLYRVNRLAFGVSSAPAIFARVLSSELKDLPGVIVFLDDILVVASSEAELLARE